MASYTTFEILGEHFDVHKAPDDGKPHVAAKVIHSGRDTSYVTAEGKMFSTRIGPGKWYVGNRWGRYLGVVKDAIALGVVSKKKDALARVVRHEQVRRAREEGRYAAREVLANAERAGVRLTVTQAKALQRKARAK